jgi:hypothetical protein
MSAPHVPADTTERKRQASRQARQDTFECARVPILFACYVKHRADHSVSVVAASHPAFGLLLPLIAEVPFFGRLLDRLGNRHLIAPIIYPLKGVAQTLFMRRVHRSRFHSGFLLRYVAATRIALLIFKDAPLCPFAYQPTYASPAINAYQITARGI